MRTLPSRLGVAVLGLTGLIGLIGLGGCTESQATAKKEAPARIESIEGTSSKRVVLEPKAAQRIALQTVEVRPATPQEMAGITPSGQPTRTAVPYDAVLFDNAGVTFTYTNPKDLDYVRQPVTVEGVKSKVAILTVGPPVGTKVVTAGVQELFGAETGFVK